MVKNLPSSEGVAGLIHGQGTKIPHALGQLSPSVATTEAHTPQLGSPCTAMKDPTCCNKDLMCLNQDPKQPNKETSI